MNNEDSFVTNTRQNKFRRSFNRDIDDFRYNISKEFYFKLVAETFVHGSISNVLVSCVHVQRCLV